MSGFRDIVLNIMNNRQREREMEAQQPYQEAQAAHLKQQARNMELANDVLSQQVQDKTDLRALLQKPPIMTATTFAPSEPAAAPAGQYPNLQPNPEFTDITGRTETQQSPERITFDFLKKRDPMQAQKYAADILTQGKSIAQAGDHPGAIDFVNNALGTKLAYLGSKDNIMSIANGDGTHLLFDVSTGKTQQIGTPKPINVGEGGALVDPTSGDVIYESGTSKYKGFDSVDLGDKIRIVPRDGSEPYTLKKSANPNTVIKVQAGTQKHLINGLDDAEYDALYGLQGAVTEGRIDPYRVNSRTAKIYAQGEMRNPGQNWNQTAANTGMERNPTFQRQRVNLQAVQEPVNDLKELAGHLSNTDYPLVNKAKNAVLMATGNADIVAFNAKRNSVMQELANAMRGAGISEGSIKLEMDNFSNAFSPAQIDAAVKNTLDVINAKLGALNNQPYPNATNNRSKQASGPNKGQANNTKRALPKF